MFLVYIYLFEIYLIQGKNALPGGIGNRECIEAMIARIRVKYTQTSVMFWAVTYMYMLYGQSRMCVCSMTLVYMSS